MIDDWKAWNPNLHGKCSFDKKAGATHSAYIQGHSAYHSTRRFGLPTSPAIHTGAAFSPLSPAHSASFLLGTPPMPSPTARMSECLIPIELEKNNNKRKDREGL